MLQTDQVSGHPNGRRVPSAKKTHGSLLILHVGEWLKAGVASYLHNILPQQVSDFGFGRIAVAGPRQYLENVGAPPGVRLLPLNYQRRRPLALAGYVWQVDALIRREQPAILHLHSSFAGFAGRLSLLVRLPHCRRTKVVYCAHGWSFEREAGPLFRSLSGFVERRMAGVTDAIVNISRAEQDAAIKTGLPADRCHIILNGVRDIATKVNTDSDPGRELTLLFIGRFDVQKGIDLLLKALKYLEGSSVRLLTAGEPVIGGLDLQWPSNAVQLGWLDRDQLAAVLPSVDAVIVPSRWEGFGLVAVEAMRAGRAVIATRRGGLPEIVRDGETGILFDLVGPRELADLISTLRKETLAEMGRRGRMRYEAEFNADRMNALLCTLYRSLMLGNDPATTATALEATRKAKAVDHNVLAS